MSDFIRSLIRWILVVLLAVLVIILVIKLVRRTDAEAKKKKANETTPVVHTIRDENDTTTTKQNQNTESTLIVNAQDTASTRGYSVLIGTIILGSTTFFIYKKRQESE